MKRIKCLKTMRMIKCLKCKKIIGWTELDIKVEGHCSECVKIKEIAKKVKNNFQ